MRRIQRQTQARCRINDIEYPCTVVTDVDAISGEGGGLVRPDEFSVNVLKSDLVANMPDNLAEVEVLKQLDVPPDETSNGEWITVQIKSRRGLRDQSSPSITFEIGSDDT